MKLLQLNLIDDGLVESLADSFNDLPETNHKDGKYRLRRYSVVEFDSSATLFNSLSENEITILPQQDFTQSEKLNKYQGGAPRSFEEIEPDILRSEGMREICFVFRRENDLKSVQEIEIHQIRAVTGEDGTAEVAPEGVHQDGFDCIAIVGVNRHNIEGGELMVYKDNKSDPFMSHKLIRGEMVMIDDQKLWHNAKSILAIDEEERGHGDWFILCANR